MGRGLDSIIAQGDVELEVEEPAATQAAPAGADTAAAGVKAGGSDLSAEVASDVVADEAEPAAETKDPKAAPAKKEEPTSAAFAALARKRQELRSREETHSAERTRLESDARTFQASVQRFQADAQTFEKYKAEQSAKLKEQADAHAATLSRVFTEKDAFFEAAEKAGVTAEDIHAWATGKMTRRAALPPPPPKGMTQEEIDARLEDRLKREREEWQKSQTQRETSVAQAQAEAQFVAFVEKDDKAFEAANLIFSQREIAQHGNEIASMAQAKGLRWSWAEVASALNELAESDPRYQKIIARAKANGTAAGAGIPNGRASAPPKLESRSSSTTTNASEPRAQEATTRRPAHRKRHDERLSRVLGTAGARLGDR